MSEREPEESQNEIDYSMPFRAKILKDCRPEIIRASGDLSGKEGWCLGEFEQDGAELGDEEGERTLTPLIRTDSEDLIWGSECWWIPLTEGVDGVSHQALFDLEVHIRDIRQKAEGFDPSLN